MLPDLAGIKPATWSQVRLTFDWATKAKRSWTNFSNMLTDLGLHCLCVLRVLYPCISAAPWEVYTMYAGYSFKRKTFWNVATNFFLEDRDWLFIQTVSLGDDLQKKSKSYSLGKKIRKISLVCCRPWSAKIIIFANGWDPDEPSHWQSILGTLALCWHIYPKD